MTEAKLDLTQGDLLTQRGIVGGLLAGAFIAAPFAASPSPAIRAAWQANGAQLAILAAILGIAATHVSFELFMPMMQKWVEPFAARAFAAAIKASEPVSYSALRHFREHYFHQVPAGDHHAQRLTKHESLRRTSTYLTSAGIVAVAADIVAAIRFQASWVFVGTAAVFAGLGFIAQCRRTVALGRALGYAFQSAGGKTVADIDRLVHSTLRPSDPAVAPKLLVKSAEPGPHVSSSV